MYEEGEAEFWDWKRGRMSVEVKWMKIKVKMTKVAQEISGSHFDSCVGALS